MERIDATLKEISEKLDLIIQTGAMQNPSEGKQSEISLDVDTLLNLPDHLRKTALTVSELAAATADMVADRTGRTRASESDYLNQLVTQGLLKKTRKSRDVYFSVGE